MNDATNTNPKQTQQQAGNEPEDNTNDEGHLVELMEQRLAKVKRMRERGIEPWPVGSPIADRVSDIITQYEGKLENGEETEHAVEIAGRIIFSRGHGKLVFLVLRERGQDIQIMVSQRDVGEENMAFVDNDLDTGDWIKVRGNVLRSKRGELSVKAKAVEILSKAIRPLPDKFHGLSDTDTRYRQRYVDLIVNEESRSVFITRSKIIQAIRNELLSREFIEVETPILHPIVGGATAKPFITHHNALDMDLYLRVAPELYLKRLIVGGLDRVFEIGRTFRNEGISTRHNPEFTMVETYQTFADASAVMDMTEALIRNAAQAANGNMLATQIGPDGTEHEINLEPAFARCPMNELVSKAVGREVGVHTSTDVYKEIFAEFKLPFKNDVGPGKLLFTLYDELVEHTLIQPTFVIDYPVEVSPLSHVHRDLPDITERFELIIGGRELANGFGELADPMDQRARFEEQVKAKAKGDDEAMMMDHDFVRALEFGLPPTGGLGIGIDRLVMLLTGTSTIRDVLFFPTLRLEK